MYKTRMATFNHQGQEIIVVPLDCSFGDRPPWQRREALSHLQRCALKAGFKSPAAAVWRAGGKLHFIAPDEWHHFLKNLTWNIIISNLSAEIQCHDESRQSHI
ncbi:MAG: hypothetical protein KA735_15010 [Burkholderiaceae bacterium]|nr:hypothetical protein [Burkholderiaceae bacterium]